MGLRVILAAALALALIPWGAEAALPVDPGTGEIWISTDITVQNETITPEKNLTVGTWSTLTLINCRLVMNPYTKIWVIGSLIMRNVTITSNTSGPMYAFMCFGQVDMDGCTVSNSQSWTLHQYSHDCSITNSTFNMSGSGIEIQNGTPLLRGNRFIAGDYNYYYSPMVRIRTSAPVLECNTFEGYGRGYDGLEIGYPASPLVANNSFVNCSLALLFYYIHQHLDGGGVSPPPGNPARLDDNAFQNCLYGIITSDSPMGHGQGRAIAPRAGPEPDPIFIADGNRFENCTNGINANGEAPSVIKRCDFSGNQEGVFQSQSFGMHISSSAFTNNSIGVRTSSGDLSLAGCTFDRNGRNLVCENTDSRIEGNTFYGGNNTTASLYSWSDISYHFANNTVNGGNSTGLRLEGTGVVFNNTFKDCPFGVYRAVRQYGQGHGRDIGQGPTAVHDMAVISQNRFENNTRGIYSEGYSDISGNEFTRNGVGVEVSSYTHPVEERSPLGYAYNQYVDRFTVERNTFTGNSAGILFLVTNPTGEDGHTRDARDNSFENNTIGIDLVHSEAACTGNNFSENAGWAFRLIESQTTTSNNDFGGCDRVLRQGLYDVRVLESPFADPNTPYNDYVPSDNASFIMSDTAGGVICSGITQDGLLPAFQPDGFDFYYPYLNLTTEMVRAGGLTASTSPVLAEARKPQKGAANATGDLDKQDSWVLYLQSTPDIVVLNFTFASPAAIAGEHLVGCFTVLNDNTFDPFGISLQNVVVDVALDGSVVQTSLVPWLRSGIPEVRNIEWTATPGNHTWTVHAEPKDQSRELRKDNNQASFRIEVNGRPEAILEADRSEGISGDSFNFSGAGSRDDGSVAGYLFDFGDGAATDWNASPTAIHSYSRPGLYEARLKVRDDRSLESDWSASWPVTIANRLPTLSLVVERTDVWTLEPVNLSVSASDPEGSALSVDWDFGDGARMSGRGLYNVSHAYADNGSYTVRAVVSDEDGGAANKTVGISVRNRPPQASFAASPAEGTVLTRFSFLATASDADGRVVSFLWDLGDGTDSKLERPRHNYKSPGAYNVSLVVMDDDGAKSAPFILKLSIVNNPPVARARLSSGTPRVGQAVTFDGSASFDNEGPSISISWDFGDGTVATGPVVKHAFKRPGNYTVRARVTDSFGAVSEAVIPVNVLAADSSADGGAGWRMAASGAAILTMLGVIFLAWVLRNRPASARKGPRIIRRVRRAKNVDAYALRLARSRRKEDHSEHSNRTMYDSMNPVRDSKK